MRWPSHARVSARAHTYATRPWISYDSTAGIARSYAGYRNRYRTGYRTTERKVAYDLRRLYQRWYEDSVRFTAIVRLDIVMLAYRYRTDTVTILRIPHLRNELAGFDQNQWQHTPPPVLSPTATSAQLRQNRLTNGKDVLFGQTGCQWLCKEAQEQHTDSSRELSPGTSNPGFPSPGASQKH